MVKRDQDAWRDQAMRLAIAQANVSATQTFATPMVALPREVTAASPNSGKKRACRTGPVFMECQRGYMSDKMAPALVHFIPPGMLVLALGRWPYGYYMLLRVVVAAAALLVAGLIYQQAKSFTVWFGLFLIVAIIFNPILPLHLTRGVWSILNVAAAAIFAGHFFVRRAQLAD
jgi:hypothetical protein